MQPELLKILQVHVARRSGCAHTAVLPQQLLTAAGDPPPHRRSPHCTLQQAYSLCAH